jgi:hypothetical protein
MEYQAECMIPGRHTTSDGLCCSYWSRANSFFTMETCTFSVCGRILGGSRGFSNLFRSFLVSFPQYFQNALHPGASLTNSREAGDAGGVGVGDAPWHGYLGPGTRRPWKSVDYLATPLPLSVEIWEFRPQNYIFSMSHGLTFWYFDFLKIFLNSLPRCDERVENAEAGWSPFNSSSLCLYNTSWEMPEQVRSIAFGPWSRIFICQRLEQMIFYHALGIRAD